MILTMAKQFVVKIISQLICTNIVCIQFTYTPIRIIHVYNIFRVNIQSSFRYDTKLVRDNRLAIHFPLIFFFVESNVKSFSLGFFIGG